MYMCMLKTIIRLYITCLYWIYNVFLCYMIVLLFSYSALAIIIKDKFHASGLNVSEVAHDCQLQVAR